MKNSHLAQLIVKGSGKKARELGVDDLQSLLLQISFALMMVFMMAYFLFRAETRKEQQEQLLELERQKLVIAVAATDAERSLRYGLDVLAPTNHVMRKDVKLLDGDKLAAEPTVREAFLKAARNGALDFASPLDLRRRWLADVFEKASLGESEISRESMEWLSAEADSALTWYGNAIRYAEYLAATELQRHWMANPSLIDDPKVADILARLDAAGEDSRLLLVTELTAALKRHAFDKLAALAGAEMLK